MAVWAQSGGATEKKKKRAESGRVEPRGGSRWREQLPLPRGWSQVGQYWGHLSKCR